LRVGAIRHSSKLRARQTAGLLAARLLPGGEAEEASGLAPNDPVETWIPTLAVTGIDTMLVGHQPFMGRLVAELICGRSSSRVLAFQPGMVAALERSGSDGWVLAWALPPSVLQ
jgi:phosphohistidine phosphatase